MSRSKLRRFRVMERRFLRLYSVWQETHRMEIAAQWLILVGKLLKLNPAYSVRLSFQKAF